jgi:hypothetical protein
MKNILSLALSTLAVLVAGANTSNTCSSIEVRKEWRALSKAERKDWIDAVNVS